MTRAKIGTGRTLPRMLVTRVGWMTYYAGSLPGDEQPIGGGSYNEDNIGHELYNFLDLDGKLYGYAQPASKQETINLKRIDPTSKGDELDHTLVIFVASNPDGGQFVVGWYRNAVVYRHAQRDARRSYKGEVFVHYFEASTSQAVLLPLDERKAMPVPQGSGSIGQRNLFYVFEDSGVQRNLQWLEHLVDLVEAYDGENLLRTSRGGPEIAAVIAAESTEASNRAQGFLHSARIRQAIEWRAMAVTRTHFEKQNWKLDDHSATRPYDLLGTKADQRVFIEVKGTQSSGSEIFLTPNEVKWAKEHYPQTVLAVVTNIEVVEREDKIEAKKGNLHLFQPWKLNSTALEPLAYKFQTGL